jgi:hypothetical protein
MQLKFTSRFRHPGALVVGIGAVAFAASVFAAMQMPIGLQHANNVTAGLVDICTAGYSGETEFAAENSAAMDRMMAGMNVKPSGSVDHDFAEMMIAHHQGAIDMALSELRHGSNEQLRRIAQEIVVEQQQEISAMHLAIGQPLPPSAPAPTQTSRM